MTQSKLRRLLTLSCAALAGAASSLSGCVSFKAPERIVINGSTVHDSDRHKDHEHKSARHDDDDNEHDHHD